MCGKFVEVPGMLYGVGVDYECFCHTWQISRSKHTESSLCALSTILPYLGKLWGVRVLYGVEYALIAILRYLGNSRSEDAIRI